MSTVSLVIGILGVSLLALALLAIAACNLLSLGNPEGTAERLLQGMAGISVIALAVGAVIGYKAFCYEPLSDKALWGFALNLIGFLVPMVMMVLLMLGQIIRG